MSTTKKRSAIPKGGNDNIMTPDSLALAIVKHFNPFGNACEPCCGKGAFTKAMEQASHVSFIVEYEITEGADFLVQEAMPKEDCFDWIITNPPWSKIGSKPATKKKPAQIGFLEKSMQHADNIVFLCYANAWFVKARVNLMRAYGFHFREFAYVANPKKPWPQMGLQLAAVHISRQAGKCKFSNIDWKP